MPKFSYDNFGILVGVIPPTGIACPFSDIPPSSFFFAFILRPMAVVFCEGGIKNPAFQRD
jgi:hypothetical protein